MIYIFLILIVQFIAYALLYMFFGFTVTVTILAIDTLLLALMQHIIWNKIRSNMQ